MLLLAFIYSTLATYNTNIENSPQNEQNGMGNFHPLFAKRLQ